MTKRRNHSPAFKGKVALAALSGEKTIAGLSSEFGVHQTQIHKWVKQLKESAAGIFSGEIKTEEPKKEKELTHLHANIGQLISGMRFFSQGLGEAVSVSRRQSMVKADHATLSIVCQCRLLAIVRSGL